MSGLPGPDETIVAIASPPGGSVRGIVRITGPKLRDVLAGLCGYPLVADWPSRAGVRSARTIVNPLVEAHVSIWPDERSYTGQPLAELHVPGAPALLDELVAAICRLGARLAVRGEFTLRAVLSGRMDLTRAEGVLGVIDAESPEDLGVALRQLGGVLGHEVLEVRSSLLNLLADLEAGLDFAHEDLEFVTNEDLLRQVQSAARTIASLEARTTGRLTSAAVPRVVLAGPPNAGKSTLFNALAGRPLAIVSDVRGTTRDAVIAQIVLDGLVTELCDTAGLDSKANEVPREDRGSGSAVAEIEAAAQAHSQAELNRADLIVWCTPAGSAVQDVDIQAIDARRVLVVTTQADLLPTSARSVANGSLAVSAHTGAGLDKLRGEIRRRLLAGGQTAALLAETAARCRPAMAAAREALGRAGELADCQGDPTLIAAELREALDAIGQVTGTADTEELLGRIFQRFCIGK